MIEFLETRKEDLLMNVFFFLRKIGIIEIKIWLGYFVEMFFQETTTSFFSSSRRRSSNLRQTTEKLDYED